MRHSPVARLSAVAATALLSCGLVACTDGDGAEPPAPSTTGTTDSAETTVTPASTSSVPSATTEAESESSTATETASATSTAKNGLPVDVAEAYEVFGSLAPKDLFEQFESCNPSGINDAYECSGQDVGQFQFFNSDAKAASTTQLLTELRSSRVVEDTGGRVVGWSTLGTTAVITVVDNDEGLVMQQLVSSDRQDPQEVIYQLGLVEESESASTSAEPTEESED